MPKGKPKGEPWDATDIHVHHIDPGYEPIRQEIVTPLGQSAYVPTIDNDIAGTGAGKKGLARETDAEHHGGLAPYATYVARTIFLHTLAFNESLKGVGAEELRHSELGPVTDCSFVEEARKRFIAGSAYLDDRPGASMRFLAEACLRQVIRREEQHVAAGEAREWLNDRIREIFGGNTSVFEVIPFPGGSFNVPDELGDGRPNLIVVSYDAVSAGNTVDALPQFIEKIYLRKGSEGSALRILRNNVVFAVADGLGQEEIRRQAVRRLALQELKKPERLNDLAEHQRAKIRELEGKSEHDLAIAIQQCYRQIFYPSRERAGGSNVDLAHSAITIHSASDSPGAGQRQFVRALLDLGKLQISGNEPCSPSCVRDRTPLKSGQITTRALRDGFRRDPAQPILTGNDSFILGVRRGVEQREYIYHRGDLLLGPGDPAVNIEIDENSVVFTMTHTKNVNRWPRAPNRDDGDKPPIKKGSTLRLELATAERGRRAEVKAAGDPPGGRSADRFAATAGAVPVTTDANRRDRRMG